MAEARTHLQYESFEAQTHAARLGMWLFLVSEILLFSGLFVLYASYRTASPEAFAEAARHSKLWLGTGMTFLLLTSSFTVALGVYAVRHGRERQGARWLGVSAALGVAFLALKLHEYSLHAKEGLLPGVYYRSETLPDPAANAFFTLYYFMTGLHGLHVLGGVAALAACAWAVRSGRVDRRYPTPAELSGMYWHLVDAIWLFLWPMFYLMR